VNLRDSSLKTQASPYGRFVSSLRGSFPDNYAREKKSDKFGHKNCVNLRDFDMMTKLAYAQLRADYHRFTAELRNNAK